MENLDAFGLYSYLQPGAAALFRTERSFKKKYLGTMDALKTKTVFARGETMSVLIRDYLDSQISWDGKNGGDKGAVLSVSERYKNAFTLARSFVLPMNPPRVELDAAIRLLFAEHGVVIKRSPILQARPGGRAPVQTDRGEEAGRRRREFKQPAAAPLAVNPENVKL